MKVSDLLTTAPPIVYHGTPGPTFDHFDTEREGVVSVLGASYPMKRHGLFFSEDPQHARSFADRPGSRVRGTVMACRLSIHHPLIFDAGIPEEQIVALEGQGISRRWIDDLSTDPDRSWEAFDDEDGHDFVAAARRAGFDGARIVETDPDTRRRHRVWVAFDPGQVQILGAVGEVSPKPPLSTSVEKPLRSEKDDSGKYR